MWPFDLNGDCGEFAIEISTQRLDGSGTIILDEESSPFSWERDSGITISTDDLSLQG